jgi:phage gp46-like protein
MDIAIAWVPALFEGDWFAALGGLATDGGIHTAVCVSLFSWRRAEAGYVPPAGSSPELMGWWADTYTTTPIGSRLWQLRRAVKTDETTLLRRAEDICLEALQWLVDDGVASGVSVQCFWNGPTTILISVVVEQPGNATLGFNFSWAWTDVPAPQPATGVPSTYTPIVTPPPIVVPDNGPSDYTPDYETGDYE